MDSIPRRLGIEFTKNYFTEPAMRRPARLVRDPRVQLRLSWRRPCSTRSI